MTARTGLDDGGTRPRPRGPRGEPPAVHGAFPGAGLDSAWVIRRLLCRPGVHDSAPTSSRSSA